MVTILNIIISTILAGSLLVILDLPVISGTILASGAGERWSVRIAGPAFLFAGIMFPALTGTDPMTAQADTVLESYNPGEILSVGLATFMTTVVSRRFSRFQAVVFSFLASMAGVSLANGSGLRAEVCLPYVKTWIAAPLSCSILAAAFYRIHALANRDRNIHLAVQDARLLRIATLLSFLLLAVAGYNSSLIFNYFPSHITTAVPAKSAIGGGCAVLMYIVFCRRIRQEKWSIADNDLDINSQSILAVTLSMLLTMAFFSCNLPGKLGMAASPLPAGTLFVAALAGISVSRRRALVDGETILETGTTAVASPLFALMVAYCLTKAIGGSLTGTAFVIALFIAATVGIMILRKRGDEDLQRQLLLSREQQAFSTQKSLSALEVKAEMTEKDLLDKLDGKRKELVDFALGIGDQKKFMEKIYDELKEVRSLQDGPEKDKRMDSLLSSLRERMYFTSEINDFYARSEVLHRDFNRRLGEAFPNLTENERKLANLLRQGFSSKYIASLMNITPKSVEINRYRLRAKLGLSRSDNLIKFIKSI